MLTCPLLCYDSVFVDSAENCGVPAVVASFVARPVLGQRWWLARVVQVGGPCQSTEAFGCISYDFYVNADSDPEVDSRFCVGPRMLWDELFMGFPRECRLRS